MGSFISHQVLEDLYASPLISEIAESAELMGKMENSVSVEEEEGVQDEVTLVGVNRMKCIEGNEQKRILPGRVGWTGKIPGERRCLSGE